MKRMVILSLCLASLTACSKKDKVEVEPAPTLAGKWVYVGYKQCSSAGCQTINDNSADSTLVLAEDQTFTANNGIRQEKGTYSATYSSFIGPLIYFTTSTRYPGASTYILDKDTLRINSRQPPYSRVDYYRKSK